MAKINVKFKDRLFRLVFQDKRSLLELYNALNNSNYQDPEALDITVLENALYMGMKNDLSFLVGDVLNLYEHQSTYNPNMPARGFFYLADVYRKYVEQRKLNLYGSRLARLPLPQYLVFYNGLKNEPDRVVLKLSDAFVCPEGMKPCLELEAVMLNINLGHNRELMERCDTLRQYAQFVAEVRSCLEQVGQLETAVDRAVENCIREGILAEFLSAHRAEVLNVILYEYNEQEHIAMERAEAEEEGIEKGKTIGMTIGVAGGVLDLLADLGDIPEALRQRISGESSIDTLKAWLRLAARAESVDDFVRKAGL